MLQWDPEDVWEAGYGSESSTEETTNRVGKIPAHYYDDMPHIGYNIDGKKIMRPIKNQDALDKFLDTIENEDAWMTVRDELEGKDIQLTEQELDVIRRLVKVENPDANYDPYEPTIEWFSSQVMPTPLNAAPEPKRRFAPSKWEHQKMMKIVRAIRSGRIVPSKPQTDSAPTSRYFALWNNSDVLPSAYNHPMRIPAPPLPLPTHEESYNPPAEYLFSPEELKEWEEAEPSDRRIDFVPKKFDSLRKVGAYEGAVKERFERCLDLYLAPRKARRKPRLDIDGADDLLPKLPDKDTLRPFPEKVAYEFQHGDGARIRSVDISANGEWTLTGGDDGSVRLWETRTGRKTSEWKLGGGEGEGKGPVYSVSWCKGSGEDRLLFAVAIAGKLYLISPIDIMTESQLQTMTTKVFNAFEAPSAAKEEEKASKKHEQPEGVRWRKCAGELVKDRGVWLEIKVPGTPKQVVWHAGGDYFASVASDATNRAIMIHQLSSHQTQAPLKKLKGDVQKVDFHPSKAQFFVATQRTVRVYDLVRQTLVKTLLPNVKWISSMDIHPLGDNVLVGSYDKILSWHDMDLSDRPYRTLKFHGRAIRSVAFSSRFPLFLSTSDDGAIHIFHATVYSDLLTNPLIVPLKILHGHEPREGLGVLDARWHPREPWLVSVGADGIGKLWTP
ncbi:BOP1NT-domain-containing protein [Atractiella rhizophila]|nr:BOP1NT-domain-containing protein [Atractiella rhizophila]